jgi:adenylylsulfate kinase
MAPPDRVQGPCRRSRAFLLRLLTVVRTVCGVLDQAGSDAWGEWRQPCRRRAEPEPKATVFQAIPAVADGISLAVKLFLRGIVVNQAFAVWLTGLPASGKSAIAGALMSSLSHSGLVVELLESDALRRLLTPAPTYTREERDLFYAALAFFGSRLVAHGVSVVFDATANRRAYRDLARALIPNFLEVAVICPLEVCRRRDPKGIYRRGETDRSATVPGLQEPYEPPLDPEVVVDTTTMSPGAAAAKIMEALYTQGYLTASRSVSS